MFGHMLATGLGISDAIDTALGGYAAEILACLAIAIGIRAAYVGLGIGKKVTSKVGS